MNEAEEKKAALAGLLRYREKLRSQINKFEKDLEAVERSIAIISLDGGQANTVIQIEANYGVYKELSPQKAAKAFLVNNPGKRFKASQVKNELVRLGGFKSSGDEKSYGSMIQSALDRLVKLDVIKQDMKNKAKVYYVEKDYDV